MVDHVSDTNLLGGKINSPPKLSLSNEAYNNQGKMELKIMCNEDDGGWLIM